MYDSILFNHLLWNYGYTSSISKQMLYFSVFSDAQKMLEEKQKRIDGAHKALQLLHNAHIVWPNPASEVLLTGSFDGWATQV